MVRRDWMISLKHVYREAKFLADFLATKGHDLARGNHSISITKDRVLYWARYDLIGGSESRTIIID
ncbi:hypothetical protein LINPERPRIM_LOCUS7034 [Linum perenne]